MNIVIKMGLLELVPRKILFAQLIISNRIANSLFRTYKQNPLQTK